MAIDEKIILVWGLHGVGKTSMIYALPHELEKLSKDDGLIFKLTQQNDDGALGSREMRFKPSLSKIDPTLFHESVSLNLNVFSSHEPEKSRKYKLVFVDDKGDEMKEALDKALDITPENNIIRNYLEVNSKGIIALFEYHATSDSPQEKYERAELLINLLDVLSVRKDGVSLAICINKIDKSGQRWKNPRTFFEMVFDHEWNTVFQTIKLAERKNVRVNFFVTSMVGFYRNSHGMTVPNFNGDGIANNNIIRPWNVTAPLFWMLEDVESEDARSFWGYFSNSKKNDLKFPKSFF